MKYDSVTQAAIEHVANHRFGMADEHKQLRAAIEAKYPGAIARAKTRAEKATFDRKFIGPVPDWAKRYVAKYGRGHVDSLTIRQSRTKGHSSGHCAYADGRLVVTLSMPGSQAGLVEQQATVLHEIAHALALWDGHGDRFYDEWFKMLRAENLYRAMIATGRFVGVSSLKDAARRQRRQRAS